MSVTVFEAINEARDRNPGIHLLPFADEILALRAKLHAAEEERDMYDRAGGHLEKLLEESLVHIHELEALLDKISQISDQPFTEKHEHLPAWVETVLNSRVAELRSGLEFIRDWTPPEGEEESSDHVPYLQRIARMHLRRSKEKV